MPAARPPGVRASVPATSANLGPGFDALGLAVDLRDELLARVTGEGVRPGQWSIASYAEVSTGEDNLVLRAMRATFAEVGWTPAELAARFVPRVPMSRGLGSSAAAICAVVTAALAPAGDESVQVSRDVAAAALPIARRGWRAIPTTSQPASRRLHHRLHRFPWTGGGGPARAGIAAQRGRCHPGSEPQRVLRLLVKHLLINPDKITIRHSVPPSCQLSVRCPYRPATIPWSTPTSSLGCDRGERGSRSAQLVRASGVQHSPDQHKHNYR